MRDWNDRAQVCGNCRFWLLAGYQHDWPGCEPNGAGGSMCNGDLSDCRRRSPTEAGRDNLSAGRWPQTGKRDFCGEFEMRAETHRRQRVEDRAA